MYSMSTATTFATIVSLLAEFISRREANEAKSYDDFMAWLSAKRHDDIKSILEINSTTTVGIKALLNESQREIISRLQSLDRNLAGFAASFEAYRGLAEAAHPNSMLSAQAISILEQFVDSGACKVLLLQSLDGPKRLVVVDGPSGNLTFSDPLFVEDDLSCLVEIGFLEQRLSDRQERVYSLRRLAARFVENSRKTSLE